jgi:hypothetical protein
MFDSLKESLEFYRWLLYANFRQNREEAIEILLMLVVGHVFGYYTPNQLSQRLGVCKSKLYQELKNWSLYQWRRQLMLMGCQYAVELLKALESKSAATHTRMRVTLGVDDTVIDRLGRVLALTYSWWSGRAKKVVRGQNILGITIKIGNDVIPLVLRPIGKQGCANTSKPQVFETLLDEVYACFKVEGIDLTQYPISFDSWYGSNELVTLLQDKGFDQIAIHAKSSYVFEIGGIREPLSEQKHRIELKPDPWGCRDTPVARCQAESPTFGTLILLLFRQGGQVKAVMMFGRKLRACEILSIWRQHHGIEQFWRALKTVLHIRQMRLRGRQGVYATLAIKVIAYLFMLKVARKCHFTLQQLQMEVAKQLDIEDFFSEHFHPNVHLVSP